MRIKRGPDYVGKGGLVRFLCSAQWHSLSSTVDMYDEREFL